MAESPEPEPNRDPARVNMASVIHSLLGVVGVPDFRKADAQNFSMSGKKRPILLKNSKIFLAPNLFAI